MHRTTIYHWLKNVPSFAEAAVEARKEYVHTLRDEVKEMSSQALSTLRNLLNDPATPPHVRLRTALAILERPHFPDPDWHFPESLNSERQEEVLQAVADLEASMRAYNAQVKMTS